MKVIALAPVKNEAWVLACTLENFLKFSDEVILLDDNSIDETVSIAKQFPKVQIEVFRNQEKLVNMSERRQQLLLLGRKSGGTHFIFLDADEILVADPDILKKELGSMSPGDTLLLPWVNAFDKDGIPVYDASQTENHKDFIFCDDNEASFSDQALSEPRTPLMKGESKRLTFSVAHVLHLQYLAKIRNVYKQVWYRMQEYIEGKRAAIRINTTYAYTKDISARITKLIDDSYTLSKWKLIDQNAPATEYLKRIDSLFLKYGINFFEPLDIWHIEELREKFIKVTGEAPKPIIAPFWLMFLNDIKNELLNTLRHERYGR